ncbi:hypothetical protein FJY94_00110 [Candidatus Kaiserbacteria bacterium]|nr:hypothetical protein [Candidatus Kaiserbacteria bacterium]
MRRGDAYVFVLGALYAVLFYKFTSFVSLGTGLLMMQHKGVLGVVSIVTFIAAYTILFNGISGLVDVIRLENENDQSNAMQMIFRIARRVVILLILLIVLEALQTMYYYGRF